MVVYLDHAATSPIRPEVLQCYTDYLSVLGNPSSVHTAGQTARKALEEAREEIAKAINCNRSEVVFTAGGTEADNLAVKGLYWSRRAADSNRGVVVSAQTEHHAVLDPITWLETDQGAEVAWIPVDQRGVLDLAWLESFLAERGTEVAFISAMWANNETGVITPIRQVCELAAKHDIPVHSDAVAALGHIEVDFASSGLAAMSLTAHKVGGPVGVGALIVARSVKLTSIVHGGGQERAMRSGTMNAAGAKAFSLAVRLAVENLEGHQKHAAGLRDALVSGVSRIVADARFSRGDAPGLPDNAHFTFPGCSGDSLLFLLDQAGICVSNGSACQAGVTAASHVLLAMGRDEAEASGCIRVTLGRDNTLEDVEKFLHALPAAHAGARRAGYTTS
jgi:cysteine desulfurase